LAILAALALLGAGVIAPGVSAQEPAPRLMGFRDADSVEERAREATLDAGVRPDSLRRHLRLLTETPHVAGTPADLATAEYVRDRMIAYGWDARLEAVPVYLNYPTEPVLELTEPAPLTLATRERGLEWDKDAFDRDAMPAFHGYGAAGEVTAQIVYANYGDVDDFKKLVELGIDIRGRIALVRYGKNFRGLKVRNAERAGAAGVIIYSDPADDGFAKDDMYPRGQGRPDDAIQRGSVQYLSEGPGDPETPGWGSSEKGKRLKPSEIKGIPKIPSIPLSWGEAKKIFEVLDGPRVPDAWQGRLELTYHVGPGPAKVHMKIGQNYAVRPIWNVIATLKGRESPDQWVIGGNHRDAWVHGANDPNSGTITMLEMARGIGALTKTGWRPRRTLVLCSWDGEEYGLLGSTEWCETNAEELKKKAVAYINVDAAVGGHDFGASGSHALADMIVEAIGDVRDPGKGGSVGQVWADRLKGEGRAEWARKNRERRWRGEPDQAFVATPGSLGSGSDYTAFEDHLGIASANLGFGGVGGVYHSQYDDFAFMDRVVDPGYAYHVAMVQIWARVALRLAESEAIPLHYSDVGAFALDEIQSLDDRADDANAGLPDSSKLVADLKPLRESAARLRDAGRTVEGGIDRALTRGVWPGGSAADINRTLMSVERAMIGTGLPGRPWFANEIYAPGLNTGYAAVPLPRLGQAVLDRSARDWRAGVDPIRAALDRAAAALQPR
jgi:N-acetylated-alpha-linked acidic dipeptidase